MSQQERLQKVRALFPKIKCDAILVDDPINLYYLTGFNLSAGKLLIDNQTAYLMVDARYFELCRRSSKIPVILSQAGQNNVNVHPQKREVRLRQEQELKEMLMKAVNKALQGSRSALWEPLPTVESYAPVSNIEIEPRISCAAVPKFELPQITPPMRTVTKIHPQLSEKTLLTEPEMQNVVTLRVLATLRHYILIEAEEGLCLVDQKAAHARIIFEKLSKKHAEVPVQGLLVPHAFDVSVTESALLLENLEDLNQIGISIYQSGPQRFLVDALPVCFGKTDVQQLIATVLEKMRDYQDKEALRKEQIKQLATAASRSSISHGMKLSVFEAQALIDQLMRCEHPYHCPMGNPTMITVTYSELQKKFV